MKFYTKVHKRSWFYYVNVVVFVLREVIQNKSNRGNRHSGNKQCADQGDDAWETTSENSDEERKHDSGNNRKNYSRRPPFAHPEAGSRTNRNPPPSGKRFNGRESHGNKTNDSGVQ